MIYTRDKNTYFGKPKDDSKDRIEVETGDSKQPDFHPQTKIMRWDNEVNFSARLIHEEENPTVETDGDKVKWRGNKVEAHFYDMTNEEHPDGASEIEIFLLEKPTTNEVKFTLNTKGLDFFYQPALTEKEIAEGAIRPENVVGSYAVYASEKMLNYTNGKEYKTGKVGHIYRPRVEDANGDWVWGDLNINKNILSVTIPQDFLDNAVYPVKHAAGLTFGYTNLGASSAGLSEGYAFGSKYLGDSGIGSSMSIGTLGSGGNIKMALYLVSNGSLVGATSAVILSAGSKFNTSNFISPPVLNSVDYYLANDSDQSAPIAYDSTSPISYQTVAYSTFPNATFVPTGSTSYKLSIYVTYERVSLILSINGLTKAGFESWNGLS